jgi:diguanylate cyclase (GGDEF) domain
MKSPKNRLPLMIVLSVVLCVIVAILSAVLINAADSSLMQTKIDENRSSMQQAAAKAEKDIGSKADFISAAAASLSGAESDFDRLRGKKAKELTKLAESCGFGSVLLADAEGTAYDADGNACSVGDTDFFRKAISGASGVSVMTNRHPLAQDGEAVVYYAPVTGSEGVTAVLLGVAPAVLNVADYTDFALNPGSGMYILDQYGKAVMTSLLPGGGSFYESVRRNPFADGGDPGYKKYETRTEEPSEDGDAPKTVKISTDYYAGDITNSRGFLGWLSDRNNTSSIFIKKPLSVNGWTLYYVRSVYLSESTVSFMITVRALLLGILAVFLAAMVVMLLVQWQNGKKIANLAYRDEITGSANWQKFVAVCNARLRSGSWWRSRHAVLCIDINRFTIYNDYYGHKTGDSLLKYLAETLDLMCSSREMAARRSRDIFVVLWNYSSADELNKRIDDLFSHMKDGPNSGNVSLSVGVYPLTEQDKDIVHAVDMAIIAEQTLEDAKVNAVAYFDEKIRARMTEEHELEKLMHTALDNGEFKLFLQPKHKVQNGALGGAEALVRWISPEKGFISPGKFIPLFEKNGFVGPVDNYILEQLCIFQRSRLRKGYKTVPISVNVSRVQLSDPNLAHEICAIVDKYSVPHKFIDIELTESACFDDMDVLVATITKLRSMGFPVSMDDFGSGYSSLNLLKDLPFDTLKIDGEFFRNVTDADRANVVVKNIIDLAKSLHMTVVAEGIEQQEQVDFLRTTECDLIQGYFYSKPISSKDFEEYMSKHKIESK